MRGKFEWFIQFKLVFIWFWSGVWPNWLYLDSWFLEKRNFFFFFWHKWFGFTVGFSPSFFCATYRANLPDYVKDLCERVRKNFFLVTRNLTRAAEKQEIRGERSCRRKNIQVGDLVFLYTPVVGQGKVKKFSSFNKGPYRVIEKFNDVNFLIQNVNKSTDIQRVHINRLTLCKERIIFPLFNEKENFDVVEKNSRHWFSTP